MGSFGGLTNTASQGNVSINNIIAQRYKSQVDFIFITAPTIPYKWLYLGKLYCFIFFINNLTLLYNDFSDLDQFLTR
ncbi:hypothetical protein D0907_16800 (plasmid) [Pseudoalteromonas lipolytica]|uniref:Uncharacterized protein n=1 Tax=Pseudoalteromonas lipolytica TaxID=570156 RepID=A0AAD0WE16_9GAMM|nr:hypothetical protein D0907_16800 [Pseudoalteromonas donghaensis]